MIAECIQGLSLIFQLALGDESSLNLYSALTTEVKAYSPFLNEWGPQDYIIVIEIGNVKVFI
jgi:hypothetical protein